MKIVIDTNVYISAIVFRGVTMRVLDMARTGEVDLYISPVILDETLSVMARAKFGVPKSELEEAERVIRSITHSVEPKAGVDAVKADPTDNRVIECAIEAGADAIVSEDKHLLRMKNYAGIPIMKVGDFLASGRQR